jgi:hypothetical protein
MPAVFFSHPQLGSIEIDDGVEDVRWAYNLNTVSFPTYGGEVVQILSVYIDDVAISGMVSTYHQAEAIYRFFAAYMQIATQGRKPVPNIKDSVSSTAYNLQPVTFTYPHRQWTFSVYPKTAAGFAYGGEIVAPLWQVTCHVIDNTPDLALIKEGIKATVTAQGLPDEAHQGTFTLNGQISPGRGNPDTDPWQTFTLPNSQVQAIIHRYGDFYNSLIPAYAQGDFSALIGAIGSKPNFGNNRGPSNPNSSSPSSSTKPPPSKPGSTPTSKSP